jgi:hypothetical protein
MNRKGWLGLWWMIARSDRLRAAFCSACGIIPQASGLRTARRRERDP